MIKSYADAKAEKAGGGFTPLPVGGYVCKIVSAKTEETNWGDKLVLAFDIAEGEFKDYYSKQFKENTSEDKKWKGTMRLSIPTGDGSETDSWAKRKMNNLIYALEDGNPGYSWDWDETKLKGKIIGLVFRNEEYDYNGKHGFAVKPGAIYDASSIRDGKYKPLADKLLKKTVSATVTPFAAVDVAVDDGDLPF